MGCCNKHKIKIPKDQQKIVKAIQNNSAVKSNRSPAGTIIRECPNCKTRTVTRICPVCGLKIS